MPIDIRDGERIEYARFTISLPAVLVDVMDGERRVSGTRFARGRSNEIAAALEFYYAAKGRLPAGHRMLAVGVEAEAVARIVAETRGKAGRRPAKAR